MNHNDAEIVGFQTWPCAVQFLLQTQANDRVLESAVDAFKNMRLTSNEKVNEGLRKYTAAGRSLAGAYIQDDFMTRLCMGLLQYL